MQPKRFVTVLIIATLSMASSRSIQGAGRNAAEEAAIRKQIAALDTGASRREVSLPDDVFWSGAYKRPVVGSQAAEPIGGERSPANRVPGSQRNKTEVIKIIVADSGDLAYEYSSGTLEFDLKSGQHTKMEEGILRVWQKQNGNWKVAAFFVQPYDRSPSR
jgi:hypothetical protein